LDVRVKNPFAERPEPIDILDRLKGGDGRGVRLAEPLGPLT
jgi:hypothetical protein